MGKNKNLVDFTAQVQMKSSTVEDTVAETTKSSENNSCVNENASFAFSLTNVAPAKQQDNVPELPSQETIHMLASMLAMKNVTSEVRVKVVANYLTLKIKVANLDGTFAQTIHVGADMALVSAIVEALDYNTDALANYISEDHAVKLLSDPELTKMQIFTALAKVRKMRVSDKLVTRDGNCYVPTSFSIRYKRHINICLKYSEELSNAIINKVAGN